MESQQGGVKTPTRTPVSFAEVLAAAKAFFANGSDRSVAQRMAGYTFAIRIANAAIAYLSQIVMARWMGQYEYGIFIYVWVCVLLLGQLSNIGLASASQRFVPEYTSTGQTGLLHGFITGSRLIGLASGTALCGLGLLLLQVYGHLVSSYALIPLALACLCLPLFVLTDIQDGIARSYNWTDLALGPPYLLRPLLLLVIMFAAFLWGIAPTAVTAMSCALIATWIAGIVQFFGLRRRLPAEIVNSPRQRDVPTWLKVSLPLFMVEGFFMLLTYTDILLLERLGSPQDVAMYWAAVKTLALVAFIYFSVSAATAHRFSEYHVTGDHERLSLMMRDAVRWTFYPSLVAVSCLLFLGKPLLMLFGPQYADAYPALYALTFGLIARAAIGPVERLLSMMGRQMLCAGVYATAFVVNIVLCFLLIPAMGLVGAACATSASLILESILLYMIVRYGLGLSVALWDADKPVTEPKQR